LKCFIQNGILNILNILNVLNRKNLFKLKDAKEAGKAKAVIEYLKNEKIPVLLEGIVTDVRKENGIIDRQDTNASESWNNQVKQLYGFDRTSSFCYIVQSFVNYFTQQTVDIFAGYQGKGDWKIAKGVSATTIAQYCDRTLFSDIVWSKIQLRMAASIPNTKVITTKLKYSVQAFTKLSKDEAEYYEREALERLNQDNVTIIPTADNTEHFAAVVYQPPKLEQTSVVRYHTIVTTTDLSWNNMRCICRVCFFFEYVNIFSNIEYLKYVPALWLFVQKLMIGHT
jgi:hypothetical protein